VTTDASRHDEPQDRLTRLCDAMAATLEAHPEYREGVDKAQIFIQDGERGGIVLHGYDDHSEAMAELLYHLTKVFKAHGQDIKIVSLGEG
jgi:hypothetical protein